MENFVTHTLKPVYDKNSKILILGTIPSVKSREYGFYYAHPQNRFWRVISEVLNKQLPVTNKEKEDFLIKNKIALWDVLKCCYINNSDDNSIKKPVENDINEILLNTDIKAVFTTGNKATTLYKRHCFNKTKFSSIYLPSTSPANCGRYKYEDLVSEYKIILKYL
jgi:hypoxanthine-DNA glycosylase